jgi:hypothetical protein
MECAIVKIWNLEVGYEINTFGSGVWITAIATSVHEAFIS